jgi:HK97 family phage major capsid protein
MKNIADLQAQAEALHSEAEAILALSNSESREPTPEEQSRFDEIAGTEEKPGLISQIKSQLERAERMASELSTIMARKQSQAAAVAAPTNRIKVPARAKSGSTLQAFKTEEDAYAMGTWALATLAGNKRAKSWCKEHGIRAAMTTGDNTSGGFLVPEPLANSIIAQRENYGVARSSVRVLQMADAVMNVPRLNAEVTTYYVGENSTITASDPVLNQIKLEAKKLAAMTVMSSEMNEDSVIGMAEMLAQSIAQAFAIAEDSALFLGDGTSTYGGIVGLAGALNAGSVVTATSRQTFGALTFADFEAMTGQVKQWRGANFKWYISQVGWANSMQRLLDAAGGNNTMTLADGAPSRQFMGYPVVISQVLESRTSSTTTARALYFGDLSGGVYMGVKRDISVQADSSRYFENDAIAVRATERFDINVFDRGTATVSGGIVALNFG